MKKQFCLFILLATVAFSAVPAQTTKVGVVSVDQIFALMPETFKADSLLGQFQKELSQSYQEDQTTLNKAIEKFYKDSIKMSKTMKEIKRKDLQDRVTALAAKEQELNRALENQKQKMLQPVKDKLLKAIKDVAKENNYTHVAYKEQMIVYPDADDISEKVKTKLGIK